MKNGCFLVIVDGLVWSQAEIDAVIESCKKHDCTIYLFWLRTSKEKRHKRAITRGKDEADSQEFLEEVEEKIPDPTPLSLSSGHYREIETDSMTPKEVVDEIMRLITSSWL